MTRAVLLSSASAATARRRSLMPSAPRVLRQHQNTAVRAKVRLNSGQEKASLHVVDDGGHEPRARESSTDGTACFAGACFVAAFQEGTAVSRKHDVGNRSGSSGSRTQISHSVS